MLTCKRCDQSFPDRYQFKMHLKTHEGEKCFKCDLCNYASVSARHLESHMLIHTDQKPVSWSWFKIKLNIYILNICILFWNSFSLFVTFVHYHSVKSNCWNATKICIIILIMWHQPQKKKHMNVPNVTRPLDIREI